MLVGFKISALTKVLHWRVKLLSENKKNRQECCRLVLKMTKWVFNER